MFEEGKKIIAMKSPRLQINRLIETKLPLSALERRLKKLRLPGKISSNMQEKDDEDLVACLEACETSTVVFRDKRATVALPPMATNQISKTITTPPKAKSTDQKETESLNIPVIPFVDVTHPSEQDIPLISATEGPLLYEGWKTTLPKVDHQCILCPNQQQSRVSAVQGQSALVLSTTTYCVSQQP